MVRLGVNARIVDAHPVTVTLRHLTDEATPAQRLSNMSDGLLRSNPGSDDVEDVACPSGHSEEVVRCRYVVGATGRTAGRGRPYR